MGKTAEKKSRSAYRTNLEWDRIPEEVRKGVEALKDKKVEEIRIYDLRSFTPFCDFVIIGTVMSGAQARVAKEGISDVFINEGWRLHGVEGEDDSSWMLIDFWDVVIHLFRPETRDYYNLEALWADFPWWPGELEV